MAAAAALTASATAVAQTRGDLAGAAIEDLMNIEITSAARKEQPANAVPAAVYVITSDAIRRSGLTTVPELLRLAPGVDVAQINSNSWAVTIRGFNDRWANKLLVLIDGRSIYTRTYAGVDWSMQDLPVDDIDRIEVIRGPAASTWGANAVNGVINVITKSAADTQGTFVSLGSGRIDQGSAAARYGGATDHASYRAYAQWTDGSAFVDAGHQSTGDTWSRFSTGFRSDWTRGADSVTAEATLVAGRAWPLWTSYVGPTPSLSSPAASAEATFTNPVGLARWTHASAGGSRFQVQVSGEFWRRIDGNGVEQRDGVLDVDSQFHTSVGRRHDVVVGLGYRHDETRVQGNLNFSLSPASADFERVGAFAQDDIALSTRLRATVGLRLDKDEAADLSMQPTTRLIWEPAHGQHVWGAWSHAHRLPSVTDTSMRVDFAAVPTPGGLPMIIGQVGNPDYQTEESWTTEGGYRLEISRVASVDVNVFHSSFANVSSSEPRPPIFEIVPGPPHLFLASQLENLLAVDTTGVEVAAHLRLLPAWRVDGSFTGLAVRPHRDRASRDETADAFDGNAPSREWQLRSSVSLTRRVSVDAAVFGVGALRQLGVPAYTRVDLRGAIALSPAVSLIFTGQNLTEAAHYEFANGGTGQTATAIPRSGAVRLEWRLK